MQELIAHAAQLGVSVHVAHIDGPERGFYDAENNVVVYDFELTYIERRCVLAHELGHVYYGHECFGNPKFEEDADYYAALLLIVPEEYIVAEGLDPAPDAIAEELLVEPRIVRAYEKRALVRLHGVTYVQPKFGRKQFRFAGLA
ncbi:MULTISPECIES: ImmA/IrrE family metallo-endopeptidase [unclassified Microbacterium]|uniref:ImmA/IrrE family metallo-endopeptidase n=1 Tax=unclassified Microbacterium TaxID=2609290 RepID=UPI0030191B5D